MEPTRDKSSSFTMEKKLYKTYYGFWNNQNYFKSSFENQFVGNFKALLSAPAEQDVRYLIIKH